MKISEIAKMQGDLDKKNKDTKQLGEENLKLRQRI